MLYCNVITPLPRAYGPRHGGIVSQPGRQAGASQPGPYEHQGQGPTAQGQGAETLSPTPAAHGRRLLSEYMSLARVPHPWGGGAPSRAKSAVTRLLTKRWLTRFRPMLLTKPWFTVTESRWMPQRTLTGLTPRELTPSTES